MPLPLRSRESSRDITVAAKVLNTSTSVVKRIYDLCGGFDTSSGFNQSPPFYPPLTSDFFDLLHSCETSYAIFPGIFSSIRRVFISPSSFSRALEHCPRLRLFHSRIL
ncbi:hypothetical protein KSP39_PZI015337 [Platanthera zijinensis]|uniref:Uncharacterized protein n=1 Tax=Platanthera zijinensis TaxID=2320716 RepID=A0AAP0G1T8_9ASPA